MPTEDRYVFDISEAPQDLIAARVGATFDAVWRFDFSAPGFCLLDLGPAVDSHLLRALMLDLKERLRAPNITWLSGPLEARGSVRAGTRKRLGRSLAHP